MSDDLTEFLRARLDEDEQTARAATNHTGRWLWECGQGAMCNDSTCPYGWLLDAASPNEGVDGTVLMEVHGYDVKEPWQGAAHIARHDPARVLAEVESKRGVLRETFRYVAKIDGEWGCCHDAEAIERGECEDYPPSELPTLRLLALPYATHPDYRPEWAPAGD